jgi:phospholipid transport system transporter-binding protein
VTSSPVETGAHTNAESYIEADGKGRATITGDVTFRTAGKLLPAGLGLFEGQNAVVVDLGAVTKVDSAGLALLLEWLRHARREGCTVTYTGLPDKLVAIAKLSGVEAMLVPRRAATS